MSNNAEANKPAAKPATRAQGAPCCGCEGAEQPSEQELLARLEEVLREYRHRPGNLIPVLQIAQGIYGYLPEHVLKHIALGLGKSFSEVAGVVGFYAFFSTQPKGKHVARVCLGTACYVRGGKQVLDAMKKELGVEVGATSADGMFSLEVARCFGACGLAPAMSIDDEVYKRVRPARIREILSRYYGQPAGGSGAKKTAAAAGKRPVKKTSKAPQKKPQKKVKVGAGKGARRG